MSRNSWQPESICGFMSRDFTTLPQMGQSTMLRTGKNWKSAERACFRDFFGGDAERDTGWTRLEVLTGVPKIRAHAVAPRLNKADEAESSVLFEFSTATLLNV